MTKLMFLVGMTKGMYSCIVPARALALMLSWLCIDIWDFMLICLEL